MFDSIRFYKDFMDKSMRDMHTCLLAKVKEINTDQMTARVQLMTPYRKHRGDVGLPELYEIPIVSMITNSFIVSVPYEVDDVVVIIVAEREIDNIVESGEFDNYTSSRIFSLNDAMIIGGLNTLNKATNITNSDDLQITKRDGTSKIILKNNGDIIIDSDNIKLGENATESVPLGDSLKTWLDSHTHSSSGSGSPSSASPSPSSITKVE